MPSVTVTDLSKRFGSIRAIDRATFDIKNCEYLCVLGPTGSGKTSLLRLIAGILTPDEGEVAFDGTPVNKLPAENRNAVYVPQTYALFPHLTVAENVMFGRLARGASREEAYDEAIRILGLVRLEHREHSFPHELSGGMQQRVALARGLASGSDFLLLDEPLGALDARLRIDIRAELKHLAKKQKLTVIHVTHDQEEAMTLADRVLVLKRGVIQQHGTPFHIYRRPENIFIANFVGSTSFFEGVVEAREQAGSTIRLVGGLTFRVGDTSHQPGEEVIVAIRDENVMLTRPSGHAPEHPLPGVVTASHFLGAHKRYEIRLANEDRCASLILTSLRASEYRAGENVNVSFHPANAVVYGLPPRGLKKELEVY